MRQKSGPSLPLPSSSSLVVLLVLRKETFRSNCQTCPLGLVYKGICPLGHVYRFPYINKLSFVRSFVVQSK
jgi:hypothetical protein